jgi:hypothetical protein
MLVPERASSGNRALLPSLVAGLVMAGVTAGIQARLLPQLSWSLELFGLLAFGLMLFFFSQGEDTATETSEARPSGLAWGAVLLTLAVIALAFRQLQGYGQALVLIPALIVFTPSWLRRREPTDPLAESLVIGAFTTGLLLTVLRIYLERAGRGVYLDFQQFYNLLGLFLGATVGFMILASSESALRLISGAESSSRSGLSLLRWRSVGIGLALTAMPLLLAALWGAKATGAYLAGLVISEIVWILLISWLQGEARQTALVAAPHLYMVSSAMIAAQFTPLVLSFALTRSHKIVLVGVAALVTLIAVAAGAQLSSRLQGGSRDSSV